jgi:hypothetical protein
MRSGFSFRSRLPVFIQLSGFTEFITLWIVISSGAGSEEYWVVPGKRKEGYCREKE